MNSRQLRTLAASGAALASLLTAGVAAAQYPPPPPPGYGPGYAPAYVEVDGPRFRGGVSLNGGALIVPGVVSIGSIGIQGQIGAQINNQWGVYAIPSFDVIVGSLGGIGFGAGVLVEYTLPGLPLSFAAGPEAGVFVAFGSSGCNDANVQNGGVCTGSAAGGALYGGRLRFEYHPIIVRTGIRRRALTIGADLRFLTGAFGASSSSSAGTVSASASVDSFAISPAVFIGYTAF